MSGKYVAITADTIQLQFNDGECRMAATCHGCAAEAAALLNKTMHLNHEKRQYTAAARLIARAESMLGFQWREPLTPEDAALNTAESDATDARLMRTWSAEPEEFSIEAKAFHGIENA